MESDFCTGCDVVVVVGGNSAGQGAVYLAKGARYVHIVIRHVDLAETMSRYLIRRIEEPPTFRTGADLVPEDLDAAGWPGETPPTLFETSLPRVYAVGEGSIVVQFIHRALAES